MHVEAQPAAIRRTRWYEYAVRFAFGGLVTVCTGLVAHYWGPVVGGLFLAFPAIFPASVTLLQSHEARDKEQHGMDGIRRGVSAVGVDAAGAALGSLGLAAFGATVWWLAPRLTAWLVISLASLAWVVVAVAAWASWRLLRRLRAEAVRAAHTPGTPPTAERRAG